MISPDTETRCGCGSCPECDAEDREDGAEAYQIIRRLIHNASRWDADAFARVTKLAPGTRHTMELFLEFKQAARALGIFDQRCIGLLTQEPERIERPGPVYLSE